MKRNLLVVALIVCVLSLASCKKGDDGPPGTANVKYSGWFTASPWKKDTVFSIWGFNYIKDEPAITQNILDSGVVLTFGKLLGYNPLVWPTGQVGQLPIDITYVQSGRTNTDNWAASATLGKLKIRFVNNMNEYNVIATQHQFRYVIIPGGVSITGRSSLASLSYEEVCRRYNIPE